MDTVIGFSFCGLQLLLFAFLITLWFRATKAFDDLIKFQYENFYDQWILDGQPRGIFWKPAQQENFLKRFTRRNPGFLFLKLMFFTPKWVEANPEALALIKRGRRFVLYWNIGVPLWFALLLGLSYLSSLILGK